MKKILALCILMPLYVSIASAQLAGNYTIDGGSAATATNYQTFSSAVSDMLSGARGDGGPVNGPNISASVVFDVVAGTYTEQISIFSITGTSATDTIVFRSQSGDSTSVVLTYASTAAATNYTLQLDGANYLTFHW